MDRSCGIKENLPGGDFRYYLDLCNFKVIFLTEKVPWDENHHSIKSHHLGEYVFYFFPTILSKSKNSKSLFLPEVFILNNMSMSMICCSASLLSWQSNPPPDAT